MGTALPFVFQRLWRQKERDLLAEHRPEAIQARLSARGGESALGDLVLGAVDGIITTFAVVAGSAGGKLSTAVIVVLGLANLIADGFSMAASNYLGTRSRQQEVERARRDETWQIDSYPRGETSEIRAIFARKGFSGDTLEQIVGVITRNRDTWVDTMLREELNLSPVAARPWRAAAMTLVGFICFGCVPLLPFSIADGTSSQMFTLSTAMSAVAFAVLGLWKGFVLKVGLLRSGLQTLFIGSVASMLAYGVGLFLHAALGLSSVS